MAWSHRKLNNLSEYFVSKFKKTVIQLVFHSVFSEDFSYFLIVIGYLSTALKQKYILPNKNFVILSCGIVVYKFGKSKHDADAALPRLLRLVIEFITGWLLKIVQNDVIPKKKVLCLDSICL